MKLIGALLTCTFALLTYGNASAPPPTAIEAIENLQATWDSLQSYTCTWTVHEVEDDRVQDRVYHVFFQKPLKTRAEVVAGDGRGSVAIWNGGSRVRGHQGGVLSFIKLNVDIHNRLATSLRGATIAQINAGWLLHHLRDVGPSNFTLTRQGINISLSAFVRDPPPDTDVVREVYILGPDGLPVKAFQYGDNNVLLKRVVFTNYQLNVTLPASTWQI